ncbi:MAG TPA: triose-phosphate isomerase [Candidatus Wujingus californicus]|uniref:triose-phosphate isomerase n=1 Tax=Candidatus Wujingus californicus TaxID=3367618 RepID=UPI001DE40104|nr:triose-phosphate isomerase [Planctomycetota bacterium]MDO8131710.1 triose-phosphate isomerase [Candidatus Brocadiales bacterium]
MKKKPLIVGNWKMNLTLREGIEFARSLRERISENSNIICGICPPFVFLNDICKILKDSNIYVVAQNIHNEKSGAFTGEISALMVKEVGCTHVLIGHSERRQLFGEKDPFINAKIKMALSIGLKPILCIGETLKEREDGKTEYVIENQLRSGLNGIESDCIKDISIAYEPVWAIGTGRTASPEQANEVHSFVRGIVSDEYGVNVSNRIYIQYGGSVKPENANELIVQSEIDGLLVGGASIKLGSFLDIICNCVN